MPGRAKQSHVNAILEEVLIHRGKTISASTIEKKLGLSSLRIGRIISIRFQNIYVDHIGYEKIGANLKGRKLYKVRI